MKNILKNKKGTMFTPLSMIMGFVALTGAVLMIIGNGNYGLILLIIATLIEAMSRVIK